MLTSIDIIKIRSALKDQIEPINKQVGSIYNSLNKDRLDIVQRIERIEKHLNLSPIKS